MTRNELIELGNRITSPSGSEKDQAELYDLFSKNVPHPNGANLFFYPENYNARRDSLKDYNPTVEEVVDRALSYKPLQL